MARLIVISGSTRATEIPLDARDRWFGRNPDNDIVISERIVSRHHARLVKHEDGYHLLDEGSQYGTLVNDQPVKEGLLKHNDIIKIGLTRFMFEDEATERTDLPTAEIMHQIDIADKEQKDERKVEADLKAGRPDERLAALYHVSRSLHATLKLEELLAEILEVLFRLFRYGRGFILLVDPDTKTIRPHTAKFGDAKPGEMNVMPFSRTIVDSVVNSRTALLIQDAQTDSRFSATHSVMGYNIHSAMCAPLWNKGKICGVVYLDSVGISGFFGKEDLELLSAVSNQAAIAIENATLYEHLAEETRRRLNLSRFFSPRVVEKFIDAGQEVGLGGKKCEITAMFTDIRGFTDISQKHTPETVVEVLNRHYDLLLDKIFENGGTLDKFIGDSVMAFFGAPIEQADAPARALKAAVECMGTIPKLNESLAREGLPAIGIGAGIATGEAIVGTIGSKKRMEYTAIGGSVNIASRLCAQAGAGEILIDSNTYLRAGDPSYTANAEEVALKGVGDKIQVYRLRK